MSSDDATVTAENKHVFASAEENEAEQQLHKIASQLAPTAAEVQQQQDEIRQLRGVLEQIPTIGRDAVEVVGSVASGLSSRHSDVDVYVRSPPGQQTASSSGPPDAKRARPLRSPAFCEAESALKAAYPSGHVDAVPSVLPLIKLRHKGFRVDISFDNDVALQNTAWATRTVQRYPVLPDLSRLVRRWAVLRGLPDGRVGGISSHGWLVMLVHVLLVKQAQLDGSLLTALRLFFAYYTNEFDYEHSVVSADAATLTRSKQDWDAAAAAPFLAVGRYPKSLAVVDTVETGRNLTQFLPPALLLLVQAELRRGDHLLRNADAARVATLFERTRSMEHQITEGWFYLALDVASSAGDEPSRGPVSIVYCQTIFQTAQPDRSRAHIGACRWNAPNVDIQWKLYELLNESDTLVATKNNAAVVELSPTDVLCCLNVAPQISPPWKTITLTDADLDRLRALRNEYASRKPTIEVNRAVVDEQIGDTADSQRVRKRTARPNYF